MAKHLTVVYTIHDEAEFEQERQRILENHKSSAGEPWAVTAISCDHEMHRLHWIEKALDADDMPAVDAAIGHTNIGSVNSLDELGA